MSPKTVIAAVTLLLLAASGCASSTHGEKMVQSYTRTKDTVLQTRASVDVTMIALRDLRILPAEHMKDAFRRYKTAIDQLETEAASAKWRATSMGQEQEEHIRAWQEEMKSIKDPSIKSTLQSRQEAVRTNFALIRLYAEDVRKAYGPFVSGNKDIAQALSIDLSPAAAASLAPAMDRVAADGATLQQKLAAIEHALNNIANGISPIGEIR
jgi:hypothetical protein